MKWFDEPDLSFRVTKKWKCMRSPVKHSNAKTHKFKTAICFSNAVPGFFRGRIFWQASSAMRMTRNSVNWVQFSSESASMKIHQYSFKLQHGVLDTDTRWAISWKQNAKIRLCLDASIHFQKNKILITIASLWNHRNSENLVFWDRLSGRVRKWNDRAGRIENRCQSDG